jgi:hypothetical protein
MAQSKRKTPSVVDLIRAKKRHSEGETIVSLAREFGLTPTHLKRLWKEKLPPAKQWPKLLAAIAPPEKPSEPEVDEEDDGIGELEVDGSLSLAEQKVWLSRVMKKAQRDADRLMRSRPDEGRKMTELAFKASNTLARITRNESDDDLRISREEIASLAQKAREKVMAGANRPLLCAHCSRELSMQWGRGDEGTTAT